MGLEGVDGEDAIVPRDRGPRMLQRTQEDAPQAEKRSVHRGVAMMGCRFAAEGHHELSLGGEPR